MLGSTCYEVLERFNDTDDSVRDSYTEGPVYLLSPDTADPYLAYCDLSMDGGGWQLLLTLTEAQQQYAGSVSPFLNDLNATKPSVTNPYSRDWTGIVDPTSGDQILIQNAVGEYVKFIVTEWCGWDASASTCTGGQGDGLAMARDAQGCDRSRTG